MIDFLVFTVKRYARFFSYFSAFLAGFSFGLSSTLFWCGLAASIVLGSLSAYVRPLASSAIPVRSASSVRSVRPVSPQTSIDDSVSES